MKPWARNDMQPALEYARNRHPDPSANVTDPAVRMNTLFNKLLYLIPIGVVGNIIYSIAFADHAMMSSVMRFSPAYLVLALFLCIVPWFTGSLRLFIWSKFFGKNQRYRDMFAIAIGAELGAAASPPVVGGGPIKIWMLMQRGFSGGAALSLAMIEGFEDALFFLIMVPIALTISSAWDLPIIRRSTVGLGHLSFWILPGTAIFFLLAGILVVGYRSKRIRERFAAFRMIAGHIMASYHEFSKTFHNIVLKGKIVFALTMTLTMIQWVCRYSIISLLLLGLGIAPRPILFMALQVIVFALLAFIPTPGGVGGAEALFSVIYRSFLPPETIGIVTAGWRFFTFYFLLLLAAALFYLFRIRPKEAAPVS
jgi:glycosyltransferase 2 family protein